MADEKPHGRGMTVNWMLSNTFSAGHKRHEYTTGVSINMIMDIFALSHLLPK